MRPVGPLPCEPGADNSLDHDGVQVKDDSDKKNLQRSHGMGRECSDEAQGTGGSKAEEMTGFGLLGTPEETIPSGVLLT